MRNPSGEDAVFAITDSDNRQPYRKSARLLLCRNDRLLDQKKATKHQTDPEQMEKERFIEKAPIRKSDPKEKTNVTIQHHPEFPIARRQW